MGAPLGELRRVERLGRRQHRRRGGAGIRRGDEAVAVIPPIDRIRMVTGHGDRRAILARYRDDARTGLRLLEPVTQRIDAHVLGAPRGDVGRAPHRYAIDRRTRRDVEPVVGDDAGGRRMTAGQDGRVTGTGLGRGMALVSGEDQAIGKALEPGSVSRPIAIEQVPGELVDRDGDDQLGRRGRGGLRGAAQPQHRRNRHESHPQTPHIIASIRRPSRWTSGVAV